MQSRPPATILTGFLGAGKTTLLNRILEGKAGRKIAVIVNEFGEIGIDHQLVVRSDEEIIELNNGCLCCTVRGDLIRIVDEIFERYGNIDHLVIETTGLADPGPVIQSFMVDDRMQSRLILDAIVTAVDCRHVWTQLESHEAQEQIAFADVILLNKIDLASGEEVDRVERRVRAMNRFARIYRTERSAIELERILGIGAFDLKNILSVAPDVLDEEDHEHDEKRRLGLHRQPGRGRRYPVQQVDVRPGAGAWRRPVPHEGHPRPGRRRTALRVPGRAHDAGRPAGPALATGRAAAQRAGVHRPRPRPVSAGGRPRRLHDLVFPRQQPAAAHDRRCYQRRNAVVKQIEALTIAIGVLGAVDTWFTAVVVPLPVWVTFIAWASFVIVGGGTQGWVRSVASNLTGIAIASITLLLIGLLPESPLIAAILVGLGSAAMVQASKLGLLSTIPAIVWGFASLVGTTFAIGTPITTPVFIGHPTLVAAAAMIVGATFGLLAETWANAMTSKSPAPAVAGSHG